MHLLKINLLENWSSKQNSSEVDLLEDIHCMSSPSHWVLTVVSTALWSHYLMACSAALQPAAREITLT